MEGERKKRKILESEEGEDDEEKKIEKFFDLIRSTREVRDRLRSSTGFNESKDQKEEKTRVEKEIKGITVWNPTFQPEDFIQDDKSSQSTTPGATQQPGPSKSATKGNEEEDQDRSEDGNHGLDLNLSL
ncbi:protein NIM1-INTERACTING 1-like [Juglans microcarpa x Juglans regia]|uniref:protein NIM1-INTERACTING 1-like n=1 Tax=Juglans microcarpa x Juglans regia TaxID=2249226 RepID=UPI001B7DCA62|nr:protein NIM1-INTERACTING 1-like [Juglans microcarpa x Juglans regia]